MATRGREKSCPTTPSNAALLSSAGVPLLLRQMRRLGVKRKKGKEKKNDSRSPRTCAGCGATRGLLPQPAGEVSAAPYGAGKINNERGNFSRTAGEARPVSPPLFLLLSKTKFKKDVEEQKRGGAIKINGVQRFDATTPTAMFAQRRRKRRWGKHKNSLYSLVTLSSCIINQCPGLSSLTFFYKCTLTLPSSAQVLACTAASL